MTNKLILIVVFSFLFARDFNKDFFSANQFYINNDFVKSIEIYEDLINQGINNHNLYYNLGNAYYRTNQIGKSIWSYKKAYFMSPRNKNIGFNLNLARNKVLRPLDDKNKSLLIHYLLKFTKMEYLFFCSLLFFISCFLILFKHLINRMFYRFISIFKLFSIFINILVISFLFFYEDEDIGVIIKNNTNILSEPNDENSTIILKTNEGYEFKIINTTNNWAEVSFNNGIQGWVKLNLIKTL